MRVIQANCRIQFTAEDIDFILSVLGPKVDSVEVLTGLLADEDTRDLILDDETLLQAVLAQPACLRISSHFYFYVLVRQVLRRSGIDDRGVADYVAELLTEFSRAERSRCPVPGGAVTGEYFFEMLAALRTADEHATFHIRAHIGNYSLFLSGVFPDRIRSRAELRGCPDLRYYEELGRSSYRVARDHRLAQRFDLASIFDTLSERFTATRKALNDLSDRMVSIGEGEGTSLLPGLAPAGAEGTDGANQGSVGG